MSFHILDLVDSLKTDWKKIILQCIDDQDILNINYQINKDLQDNINIFPPQNLIFNAFNFFNFKDLKVVILGQDPYINKGEAMGLSFSVTDDCKMPPSLRNVFKEIKEEFNYERKNKDLSDWAKQGVLLLNYALTVKEGKSGSHMNLWQNFTIELYKYFYKNCKNIVFIHWGNFAKKMSKGVDPNNNLILEWTHPSPLARAKFTGNNHFKLANEYLKKFNKEEINW